MIGTTVEHTLTVDLDSNSATFFEEKVAISPFVVVGNWLLSWVYMTGLLCSVITSVFALLGVAFLIGGKQNIANGNILQFLVILLKFWAMGFAFVSIVTLPMCMIMSWIGRRRTLTIENDVLTAWKTQEFSWSEQRWSMDNYGCYLTTQPLLFIKAKSGSSIAAGFDDNSREELKAVLISAGIPKAEPVGIKRWIAVPACGASVGMLIGFAIGSIIKLLLGPGEWSAAASFVGAIDGAVYALVRMQLPHPSAKMMYQNTAEVAAFAIAFMAIGVKVGAIAWPIGFFMFGILNGLVGAWLAFDLRRRAAIILQERKEKSEVGLSSLGRQNGAEPVLAPLDRI